MHFYLWSNKYSKWWRVGAWGYSEDIRERGLFGPSDAMRFLVNGMNDPQWNAEHEEPKTLALGEDGRWYSLVEYEGDVPPDEPAAAHLPALDVGIIGEAA